MSCAICLQRVAERAVRIDRAVLRLQLLRIGALEDARRLERFLRRSAERSRHGLGVHRLESAADVRAAADAELADVRHRHRARARRQRMRGIAGESATARSGDAVVSFFDADRARQESILGRLHAGRARLHEVLRVEVRARRVRRADRVHERQRCDP